MRTGCANLAASPFYLPATRRSLIERAPYTHKQNQARVARTVGAGKGREITDASNAIYQIF